MNVLVTGAAGLIGRTLLGRLRSDGFALTGLVRQAGQQRLVAEAGATPLLGDVLEPDAWASVCDETDAIVHCAAKVGSAGRNKEFLRVNLEGTQAVAQAAHQRGVHHFVQLSSLRVFGLDPPEGIDESAAYVTTGDAYGDSKTAADRWLLEDAPAGLQVTVLRPGYVYGDGDEHLLGPLIEALEQRRVRLAGDGSNRFDPLYAPDLAGFVSATLRTRTELPARYAVNLTPSQPVTARCFVETLAGLLDLPAPRFVPRRVAELARGAWGSPSSSSAILYDLLLLDRRVDRTRLERCFGPSPTRPLAAALRSALGLDPTADRGELESDP